MNVILFRGWLGVFSYGLNEIADQIRAKHPGVTVRVYEWDEWQKAIHDTRRWKDPFILVGHSYGVAAMFDFAKKAGARIRYCVSIDPSQYTWLTPKISGNTPPADVPVYNFYQVPRFPWSIGGVKLPGATNHRIVGVSHADMDDDPAIQQMVIKLIEDNLD